MKTPRPTFTPCGCTGYGKRSSPDEVAAMVEAIAGTIRAAGFAPKPDPCATHVIDARAGEKGGG